jgi:enoyl-CoA hydratase
MSDHVAIETAGRLGLITLNRPKALNALSLEMIEAIRPALDRFEQDDAIDAVLIRGAGGRAFCSGGDVRAVGTAAPGPAAEALSRAFFAAEYALNYRIHRYPKPYIALIDGITMGGGCGLSLHGRYRVSTERTLLAMPETVLGLFPDVGASWILSRLPGELGVYIGLTGLRLRAGDLKVLGLATHHIEASSFDALIEALGTEPTLERAALDGVLSRFAADPGGSDLPARQERVDALFSAETMSAIRDNLTSAPEIWAAEALDVVRRASPTSLAVTLRLFRAARTLSIDAVLGLDYRLAIRLTARSDFREGVRSILIDKDNRPDWNPKKLDDVSASSIDALFSPLTAGDIELGLA